MIKVGIVDDHAIVRSGLRQFLSEHVDLKVTGEANNGREALALLESVGLAARTHTILGVEANSRQFFPSANAIESVVHPDLYQARDGVLRTGTLQGPGLGMQVDKMAGFVEFVEANDMRVSA